MNQEILKRIINKYKSSIDIWYISGIAPGKLEEFIEELEYLKELLRISELSKEKSNSVSHKWQILNEHVETCLNCSALNSELLECDTENCIQKKEKTRKDNEEFELKKFT